MKYYLKAKSGHSDKAAQHSMHWMARLDLAFQAFSDLGLFLSSKHYPRSLHMQLPPGIMRS